MNRPSCDHLSCCLSVRPSLSPSYAGACYHIVYFQAFIINKINRPVSVQQVRLLNRLKPSPASPSKPISLCQEVLSSSHQWMELKRQRRRRTFLNKGKMSVPWHINKQFICKLELFQSQKPKPTATTTKFGEDIIDIRILKIHRWHDLRVINKSKECDVAVLRTQCKTRTFCDTFSWGE